MKSFGSKFRSHVMDKISIDRTIVDLQLRDFHSMCGHFINLGIYRVSRSFKTLRLRTSEMRFNITFLQRRVAMTERANFLSVMQDRGESDDDFRTRVREEARYCDSY